MTFTKLSDTMFGVIILLALFGGPPLAAAYGIVKLITYLCSCNCT